MRVVVVILLAFLTNCSPNRHTSNVIKREEGYATILLINDEPLSSQRLLGPEAKSINGYTFRFISDYKTIAPGNYQVPAGTVIFTLKRGLHTKRGRAPLGFHARAGETYEVRVDRILSPRHITVLERRTGRIATPLSHPKPLLKPARYR